MEDGKIVDLYLERNEDAVMETKAKYGSRLFSLSRRITGNREDAGECENDTYLRAWNSIPPNEPRDYFAAFLYRIVRNLSIDRVRRNVKEDNARSLDEFTEELSSCVSGDFSEKLVDEKRFAELLNSFLENEEKENRIMFVKRYFYLEAVRDIAKALSVTESKVKTTLFRMRGRLREILIKEEYEL